MLHTKKALEARARRAAKRAGLRAVKSRKQESLDNFGGFMLVDLQTNGVVDGRRYDLTPEDVIQICQSN